MPSLQELTLAHSQRLSEIYRSRDARLAEAHASRDAQLESLPGAVKVLQKYREELAEAKAKQLASDAKAAAARAAALNAAIDHRSDKLEDAHRIRRAADETAIVARRRDEEAAEAKFLEALNEAAEVGDAKRSRFLQDADRERRAATAAARRAHDTALGTSQQQYRGAVGEAVIAERREGRDSDRGYYDALRFGDAAARAAALAAEQTLMAALIGVAGATEVLRAWRLQVAAITIDAAKAEKDEFSRFRRELQALKV